MNSVCMVLLNSLLLHKISYFCVNSKSSRLNTTGERWSKDLRDEYEKGCMPFVFNERKRLVSISIRSHSAALSQAEGLMPGYV